MHLRGFSQGREVLQVCRQPRQACGPRSLPPSKWLSYCLASHEAGPALAGEMGAYGVVAGTVSVQSEWTGSVEPANDCAPSRLAMPPLPPLEKAQQQLPELVFLVRASVGGSRHPASTTHTPTYHIHIRREQETLQCIACLCRHWLPQRESDIQLQEMHSIVNGSQTCDL